MRRAALLLALALGLSACGGDGGDLTLDGLVDGAPVGESAAGGGEGAGAGEGGGDLTRWQDAHEEICASTGAEVEAGLEDLPEPESMAEVAEVFDRMASLVAPYVNEVLDLRVPTQRRAAVRRYNRMLRDFSATIDRIRAAAHFDDASTAEASLEELQVAAGEVDEALLDLGVPACVDQGDGGTG